MPADGDGKLSVIPQIRRLDVIYLPEISNERFPNPRTLLVCGIDRQSISFTSCNVRHVPRQECSH